MPANALETSTRLYEILCIDNFSSPDAVKRAYKQLALKYHPDKNLDDPTSVDRFREVHIAYEILSNAERKKKYDISLKVYKASTGQYGRAATMGGGGRSAGVNPYKHTSTNVNADIYHELNRHHSRRTGSRAGKPTGTSARTTSPAGAGGGAGGGSSGAGVGAEAGATSSQYTREQQDAFRRNERERQNELKRQLDRERSLAREKEREQKRKEQERQEELLAQRWRQQQAAYAAATASAPPRSARRANGGSGRTGRADWRSTSPSTTPPSAAAAATSSPLPQQQSSSASSPAAAPNTTRVPDLYLSSNLPRPDSGQQQGRRASPATPRPGTPSGAQRRTSQPRTVSARHTPHRGGTAAGGADGEGLSFANIDRSAFGKGRGTPRGCAAASSNSGTPPPQSLLGEDDRSPLREDAAASGPGSSSRDGGGGGAPPHSPAFPVESGRAAPRVGRGASPKPSFCRGTVGATPAFAPNATCTATAPKSGSASAQRQLRRGGSLGSNISASFSPREARRAASRVGCSTDEPTRARDSTGLHTSRSNNSTLNSSGSGLSSTASTARAMRTAAALHAAKSSAAGQLERQRQRDLHRREHEAEFKRMLTARQMLQRKREAAEAAAEAEARADPEAYYNRLLNLCILDEEGERVQLIEREEVLARRRVARSYSGSYNELVVGPALQLLGTMEEDERDDILTAVAIDTALLACLWEEMRVRRYWEALEQRARRQAAGREASEVYHVQHAEKLRGALFSEEAMRRHALEREHCRKRTYMFHIMGPEFLGRMEVQEQQAVLRAALKRDWRNIAARTVAPTLDGGGHERSDRSPGVVRSLGGHSPNGKSGGGAAGLDRDFVRSICGSPASLPRDPSSRRACSPLSTTELSGTATRHGNCVAGGIASGYNSGFTGTASPRVTAVLVSEEACCRAVLEETCDSSLRRLLSRRANEIHTLYARERDAAVKEAVHRAACRAEKHYQKRVAELESELAAVRAHAGANSAAADPTESLLGGRIAVPVARNCTSPSSAESILNEEPLDVLDPLSEACGESQQPQQQHQQQTLRPSAVTTKARGARYTQYTSAKGGAPPQVPRILNTTAASSTTTATAGISKQRPPPPTSRLAQVRVDPLRGSASASADRSACSSTTSAGDSVVDGDAKDTAAASTNANANGSGETVSGSSLSAHAVALNLARYFPRWRDTTPKALLTPTDGEGEVEEGKALTTLE